MPSLPTRRLLLLCQLLLKKTSDLITMKIPEDFLYGNLKTDFNVSMETLSK